MYRSLVADRIIETVHLLGTRISERFPGSSLSKLAAELYNHAGQAAELSRWLATPLRWVRVLVSLTIVGMLAVAAAAFFVLNRKVELFSSVADFMQGLDAAINEIIVIGAAIYFLVGLERRIKRDRALKGLHVLRSMAHIIDMHQLTKDPDRITATRSDTPSSPPRDWTPFALTRYLDYCSELLAIISKIAALHVQHFQDPITMSAVNEVEDLTNGLSRKIWQKIMILDRMMTPVGQVK
jgi:hypothetical protein